MAAKQNTSATQLNLSTYDYIAQCGVCHPGGGILELARDAEGRATDDGHVEAEAETAPPAEGSYVDGDYTTLAAAGGAQKSHFAESGVVEADCLVCHLPGYSGPKRNAQLGRYNFQWAASAGANFGTVTGTDVYLTTTKVFTGSSPTFSYNVGTGGSPLALSGGNLVLPGGAIVATPPYQNCLICHEASDTKKRGLEWNPTQHDPTAANFDVHASAGLLCMECHGLHEDEGAGIGRLEHQIGKGYERLGSVRNDLDGTMKHTCAGCHLEGEREGAEDPTAAHQAAFGTAAFHFQEISCEGCHIPYEKYNQGYLIDMSSGTQVWMLSDGRTPAAPADFNSLYAGAAGQWRPYLKLYDPDGPAGPLPQQYYPFGSKSSVWFGDLQENGEIRPIKLTFVSAAYNANVLANNLVNPRVSVTPVSGANNQRPSVSFGADGADVKAMLLELSAAQNNHPAYGNPVYVSSAGVYGLDEGVLSLVEGHGETDHNFSINHNVRTANQALGANGCADCHNDGADSPLRNLQIRDVTKYLATRSNTTLDPAAVEATGESVTDFRGLSEAQGDALRQEVSLDDPATLHAASVTYALDGANTCSQCHSDVVSGFKQTVHYSMRSAEPNENFFFPGGGRHGMLDRACALVGSNMLLNMLTASYLDPNLSGAPAQQCGSCHTNYYNTLVEGGLAQQVGAAAANQMMLSGIDCLVCHAEDYDFKVRYTYEEDPFGLNAGYGTIGGKAQRIRQDRSPDALASLQGKPSDEMCLRCHEHGRTDYKRGELPEPEYDIHYELGVSAENPCLFCHEAKDHKFNRGQMVNGDLFAVDYPVNGPDNDTSCAKCHTEGPHASQRLNEHVAKLACETCHITMTSGAETTIWGDGGFLALAKGGAENRPVKLYTKKEGDQDPSTNEELWERYKQRPIYMQFSGLTSFLAQSIPLTNPNTGTAPKIYPFKTIINPLPFDGRFFGVGVPHDQLMMSLGTYQVNRFSMFAAMYMFRDQYKALDFIDADFDFSLFKNQDGMVVTTVPPDDARYPSYAAMAQMAQFPNMLFFDKYTFGYNWYQDLGKLAATDPDGAGPLTSSITQWDAAYRPLAVKDMKTAVAVGMKRLADMMLQMGFDPTAYGMTVDELRNAYAGLTDDQLVVMAAPPGSEVQAMLKGMGYANWANYPAWSNGVTLGGHGVRREEALFCGDCHTVGGPFDQKVEVPSYGSHGMPLYHWEFYSKELLAKAEAGELVSDVFAAGYAKKAADFEMGATFQTVSQAAEALGLTFGLEGDYIAVLSPTTRLASNWAVLGYSAEQVAKLQNLGPTEGGGDDEIENDGAGSSECFVQSLGGAGVPAWPLAALAAAGLLARRRRR